MMGLFYVVCAIFRVTCLRRVWVPLFMAILVPLLWQILVLCSRLHLFGLASFVGISLPPLSKNGFGSRSTKPIPLFFLASGWSNENWDRSVVVLKRVFFKHVGRDFFSGNQDALLRSHGSSRKVSRRRPRPPVTQALTETGAMGTDTLPMPEIVSAAFPLPHTRTDGAWACLLTLAQTIRVY